MTADDIQPLPPRSVDSTMDPLAATASGTPVRADALERWARAVNTPPMQPEEDARDSSLLPSASMKFDLLHPSEQATQAPTHRLDGQLPLEVQSHLASNAAPKTVDLVDSTPTLLASMNADGARALPLSALREQHASHRDSRLDAALTDRADAERAPLQATPLATVDAWMGRVPTQPPPSVDTAVASDSVSAAGGSQQLHALIESCCSRLWVSDEAGRVPHGVMLDLGRWMPGCTVEVAKAAGVLRINLRGVEDSDRQRLEEELMGLGEGLAQKLGCQVVAAVATNKELT